jgi:hypothetical protein
MYGFAQDAAETEGETTRDARMAASTASRRIVVSYRRPRGTALITDMNADEPGGYEITPEPAPEELEALRRALDERPTDDPRGAWWREGVRENLEPDF